MKIAIIAIVLSIVALAVSVAQPTYNLLTSNTSGGQPSFSIQSFDLEVTFTRIIIRNNGTGTAHNIRVELIYTTMTTGGSLPNHEAIQFIPEIATGEATMLVYPIGTYDLNATVPWYLQSTSISTYEAYVHIECKELGHMTTSFHFQHFIS